MNFSATEQLLDKITDEGLFEKLAMAVLREVNPSYEAIIHTGMNADGKTIKAPVDGILYYTNLSPPRILAVHHTTERADNLPKKWLHDPQTVKPRKGRKPTAPAGDILKTAQIVGDARQSSPGLKATLVLTTNREPDVGLVSDVAAAATDFDMEIDIWSRSRIAHFLDTTPKGHWIRNQYLGVVPEFLSRDLLLDLSRKCLGIHKPRDSAEAWISRELDERLRELGRRQAAFLVAPSGLGKSVAAYKWLAEHHQNGEAALVLPHDVIAASRTLAHAIGAVLRELHPNLGPEAGAEALALSSPEHPLYLVVEDINRSGQAPLLAERIESWARVVSDRAGQGLAYQLVCPVWPEVLTSLGEETRKAILALSFFGQAFVADEGRLAVQTRAALAGRSISDVEAGEISGELGHDPLLIALQDYSTKVAPTAVIERFVEGVLARVARTGQNYAAADYRASLRTLAYAALSRRILEPLWSEVSKWLELSENDRTRLAHIFHDGNLLHLAGSSTHQRLGYRHDRVRNWLLIDAAQAAVAASSIADDIVADPYYAEIVGGTIAGSEGNADFLDRVSDLSPLALFYALRSMPDSQSSAYKSVCSRIDTWLASAVTQEEGHHHLRHAALSVLAQTDGPDVLRILGQFKSRSWSAIEARFRNGDIIAGVELCARFEPGTDAPWRDAQIEHAKHKYGNWLIASVDKLLRFDNFTGNARVGVLRLAGHLADPKLANAILACWQTDPSKDLYLEDYLWAAARCWHGSQSETHFAAICDAWAALPEDKEKDGYLSPRSEVSAHQLRWAFRKWVPKEAIKYLTARSADENLRSQITYLLAEIDDPVAVTFTAKAIADLYRRFEGTDRFSPWVETLPSHWARYQDDGKPMSQASRQSLEAIWTDAATNKHEQRSAFRLWAATVDYQDLATLRTHDASPELHNGILWQRLLRGDNDAVPLLIEKLENPKNGLHWWSLAKYVWCSEIHDALIKHFDNYPSEICPEWRHGKDSEYAIADLLIRIPISQAAEILDKNWDRLKYVNNFVETAIYLATPRLNDLAAKAIAECPDPAKTLQFLGMHLGIKTKNHPGITRAAQIEALAPYLQFIADYTIADIWDVCNSNGWFEIRRRIVDHHLKGTRQYCFINSDALFAELDGFLEKDRGLWIDRWLEDYIKSGATDDFIINSIASWFAERPTKSALELVQQVLMQIGRRVHLPMIDLVIDADAREVDAIRANTVFAVRRRSLQ
ncbi:DEAD/DEAH box helicase family protein [Bosea thiooxidans]|uniref:DEAD/DEAH box helicase family protein n=1 Tax=Bosea thiooxidans TaxID=53254 RepID=UPI000ABCC2A2|nr:DEAD/DEAH box helicase family protein [Bosea thiooxidans]